MNPERMGVIARTSSMAYKRARRASARLEPNSASITSGKQCASGRQSGRITSQLIRVRGQTHVWTSDYDRDVTSVLDLQRELSTAIAQHVGLQLLPNS